jgi:hypothetical protein
VRRDVRIAIPADGSIGADDGEAVTTHVTEFGLGLCAGVTNRPGLPFGRMVLEAQGLRPDRIACNGARWEDPEPEGQQVIPSVQCRSRVPTCPRCAVLRDAALEGRLPQRSVSVDPAKPGADRTVALLVTP